MEIAPRRVRRRIAELPNGSQTRNRRPAVAGREPFWILNRVKISALCPVRQTTRQARRRSASSQETSSPYDRYRRAPLKGAARRPGVSQRERLQKPTGRASLRRDLPVGTCQQDLSRPAGTASRPTPYAEESARPGGSESLFQATTPNQVADRQDAKHRGRSPEGRAYRAT